MSIRSLGYLRIEATDMAYTPTGHDELDRVLGGGIVEGGVVLIGGHRHGCLA